MTGFTKPEAVRNIKSLSCMSILVNHACKGNLK